MAQQVQVGTNIEVEYTPIDWLMVNKGLVNREDMQKIVCLRKFDRLVEKERAEYGTHVYLVLRKSMTFLVILPTAPWWRPFSRLKQALLLESRRKTIESIIRGYNNKYFPAPFFYENVDRKNEKHKPIEVSDTRKTSLSELEELHARWRLQLDMVNPVH